MTGGLTKIIISATRYQRPPTTVGDPARLFKLKEGLPRQTGDLP